MGKIRTALAVTYWLIILITGVFAYVWAFASDITKRVGGRATNKDRDRERLKGFKEGFAEGVRYQKWRIREKI